MPIPQSCVEALLIESGLSLPYAFHYKMPGRLPGTPFPAEWAIQLFMLMAPYIEICCAYSGGRLPIQKFGLFVTAGGRTVASLADRLLAHTQQASAHTPKNRTIIRDVQIETTTNPLHYPKLNVHGAKAHLTRGLHPLMADIPIISHHDIVLKNPYSY